MSAPFCYASGCLSGSDRRDLHRIPNTKRFALRADTLREAERAAVHHLGFRPRALQHLEIAHHAVALRAAKVVLLDLEVAKRIFGELLGLGETALRRERLGGIHHGDAEDLEVTDFLRGDD